MIKAKPGKNKTDAAMFWKQRSRHYDKLFWTKDKSYLDLIIKVSGFKKTDLVLDVGVGTGAVARKIRPLVGHVVGIDISESMLNKTKWEGISTIKWDIRDALFTNNVFDKVIARMCFHHIMDNLDVAVSRCYDLLKPGGRIVVAEGVPPSDRREAIDWFTRMFKLKEERVTFTESELKKRLLKNGFKKITVYRHKMESFSIKNWLDNSGISRKNQKAIMNMHRKAGKKIKDAYNMRCVKDDCLVDTKNVILTGEK